MESQCVLLEKSFMIDEQVSLDRCPEHQIDTRLKEGIVENNPSCTSTLGVDRSAMQEIQCERQFDTIDQPIDDEENAVDLRLYVTPVEMVKTANSNMLTSPVLEYLLEMELT